MPADEKINSDPYRGLIRVSCLINSINDYEKLLLVLLQITKEVLKCDAGSLMMYDEASNDLQWHVALGDKADKLKEMGRLKLGQGIAGWVAENQKPVLVADVEKDTRFFRGTDSKTGFKTHSIVCVPLVLENKLVGVLQALNPLNKPAFDEADLEVFEAYGAMAATAIEKIRWQETALQQQKMQQELEIAQEIQTRFLSQDFSQAEKVFDVLYHFHPAFQIGGDFYDIQKAADGYALILGDVTGKGVPAALLMAQALSEFRYRAPHESDPGKILSYMNNALHAQSTRGMFATAWCAVVRPNNGTLTVQQASAGHLPPLHRTEKGVAEIELASGMPLGIMPDGDFPSSQIILQKNEFLCTYTDGVTENRNKKGEEFGMTQMRSVLSDKKSDIASIKAKLLESIQSFQEGTHQRDDVTFLLCAAK